MFNKLTDVCQELLVDFPEANKVNEYLNSRLSKEAQKEFKVGYFPSSQHFNVLSNYITINDLVKLGLFYYHFNFEGDGPILKSSLEHHNLCIPYQDVYGKIVALIGRTLLSEEERQIKNIPKYKNTSFPKGHHLFGLYQAKDHIIRQQSAIVVEGQFDCMTAHSFGIKNVVALGGSGMTFEQVMLLARYTNNIVLMLDNDEAGRLGTQRAINQFEKYISSIKKLNLPVGYKDLDEFLNSGNTDAVEWIKLMTI